MTTAPNPLEKSSSSLTTDLSPVRLLLMGPPGVGKTFSAFSFPNPVYIDLDHKLNGYRSWKPEHEFPMFPFWDAKFIQEKIKMPNAPNGQYTDKNPPNVAGAFKKWLIEEARHLTPEQTLIVDSWTNLHNFFDIYTQLPHEMPRSKKPPFEEDTRAFWGLKLNFTIEMLKLFTNLNCGLVVIAHEMYTTDDEGKILGLKPLMQGSGRDHMGKDFTDVYRQRVFVKDYPEGCKPPEGKTESYVWQTGKDQYFQMACKSNPYMPNFVPAEYASFTKDWRK